MCLWVPAHQRPPVCHAGLRRHSLIVLKRAPRKSGSYSCVCDFKTNPPPPRAGDQVQGALIREWVLVVCVVWLIMNLEGPVGRNKWRLFSLIKFAKPPHLLTHSLALLCCSNGSPQTAEQRGAIHSLRLHFAASICCRSFAGAGPSAEAGTGAAPGTGPGAGPVLVPALVPVSGAGRLLLISSAARALDSFRSCCCGCGGSSAQTNPPWNLTWELVGDEAGEGATEHELGEVRLRWQPPLEPDIRSGWITLEYQIRVRDNSTLNWTLREEHVSVMHHVLLGPRPGRPLEVQVRCKPRTLGIWSEWSESLLVITEGWDLLQVLLVLGVLVSCCLLATLLLLLRCHTRMAKWLFPPVPSPRIRGIDPDMLKKGPVEEFNRMISSFHGFVSPVMHDDPWLEVTEVTCERDTLLAKVKGGWRSTGPATPTHGRPVWPGEAAAAAATIEPDLLGYFHGDLPENSAKSTANADDGYDDRQKHGDGGGGGGSEAMRSATTLPGECYTQVWDVSPDGTVCLASPAAQALRPAAAVARPAAPAAHVGESAGSKEIAESSASRGRDVTVSPTGTGDSQPPPFVLEPPALAITTTPPARLGPMIASDTHVPPTSPPSPPPQSHQAEGSSRRSDPHDERDATAIAGASSSSPHNDDDDDWEDATPLPPPPPPHNSSDRAPLRSPDSPPPVPDYTAVHAVDAHQRLFLDVRKDVVKGNGDAHKGYLPPEQLRALLLASAGVGVGVGVRVGVGSTQGYVGEERARFIRS
ncbi:prolactin receptor isoform X1 [Petromyzon marinus]|uniref:prolactin receptor isoform X1 n=1 Tax=Petromyzon marinus TaxID=7757 RepID=UPI003F7009B7